MSRGPAAGILAVGAVLAIGLVAAESFVALAILLLEGTVAVAVLAAAAMAGGWLVRPIGLRDEPLAVRWIVGAAFGLGSLALIVLTLGSAGCLSKPVAWGFMAILLIVGLVRVALDISAIRHRSASPPESEANDRLAVRYGYWLWITAVPFLVIALLAACLPPGVLWVEEGYGYDVLDYHLAVPKAWHEAGRITFLPENVYSNFPLNGEMISLLLMTLHGDAIESAFMCQIANVAQGCLFVAAAWLAGRSFSRRAGIVAGVLAATTPWLAYLSGIAYVEPGMLAMGMCSLAVLLRIKPDERGNTIRVIAAGLLAGLACGYKYTAVVLIAAPLAVMILAERDSIMARIRHALLFAMAAVVTFSPWMIRNNVNTHNPVF
ncbi:MAG TPA: glycosyltransferase family 39 protein, partial [Phycisphaerae bacterium]|nr:glycosyltransferase family 39 protein [Phycisphaerae bacterium]